MDLIDKNTWLERISKHRHPARMAYKAMYSSWWEGVVTDPALMVIAIDDHQVHRGDAVFEAFRLAHGKIYLLDAHLDRLWRSAASLSLDMPMNRQALIQMMGDTIKASRASDAVLRLFVSRGPGSFTANPYETLGSQIHFLVTEWKPLPAEKVEKGVRIMVSRVAPKESFWAQIKSCNYLHNVMMKKEAVDHGCDFSIGVDPRGHLTEGSTENLVIVDKDGFLRRPFPENILAGTTMLRSFELAEALEEQGLIRGRKCEGFGLHDLHEAREAMMIGTTLDALAVTAIKEQLNERLKDQDHFIADGKVGPVARALRDLIQKDQR